MTTDHSYTTRFRAGLKSLSRISLFGALFSVSALLCTSCQGVPAKQSKAAIENSSQENLEVQSDYSIETPTWAPVANDFKLNPASTQPESRSETPESSPTLEPSQPLTTTLLFTGIIVPARCVQAKIDLLNEPKYPYEEVRATLSAADLSIGVFNATMSYQTEPTGCLTTWQLVGRPENADAAAWAGFDMMGVATNHIKDCGLMKSWCDYAFFDTLDNLERVGIQTVGAGKNLEAALQPVVVTINGVRFGFISLGDSKMDRIVFAGDNHPGIAELIPDNITRALELVRQQADVVIAMPHWGSEDNMVPNWNQTQQAGLLAAGGADLIVGNHPHVVQAIKEIDGVPVFYGLGNFVFDQGLRDHRQGVILLVKFLGSKYVGYELIPTHTDGDGRVHIADKDEAEEILQNIEAASQALP